MSGVGKSHWGKQIAKKYNWKFIEIDHLVGESDTLTKILKTYPGKDNAEKMGHYFGMPWEKDFEEKEKNYLKIERNLMQKDYGTRKIIDLTGSCIYHPEEMKKLSKKGIIIYLKTNEENKKAIFENYKIDPKPVCWNKIFQPKKEETNQAALERCYKNLLNYREKEYEKYANIILESSVHKKAKTVEELMKAIYKEIEK